MITEAPEHLLHMEKIEPLKTNQNDHSSKDGPIKSK